MPLKGVNLEELARKTKDFSGADIAALCREAGMFALRENINANTVETKHFEKALGKVTRTKSTEEETFSIVH